MITVHKGNCLRVLTKIPSQSVDAVITDPPYPGIKRDYGVWTEDEWWGLMMGVCTEVRRILKPTGSAVFILQPNSKTTGSMRGWLFRFQAWVCDNWNMIQDVYWWNFTAVPQTKNDPNTLRKSVKHCVWAGDPNCYRDVSGIRWEESDRNRAKRMSGRALNKFDRNHKTRINVNFERSTGAAIKNGGVTPFNLIPASTGSTESGFGHGAVTPVVVTKWWVRYVCPPGGTILDPFAGSGTTGIVAYREGRKSILIERMPSYVNIIRDRINKEGLRE